MRKTPAPTAASTLTLELSTPKTPAPRPAKPAPKAAVPLAAKPAPKAAAKPAPPAIVAETPSTYFAGTAGRAWRMSGKHAVAYVHTAALASELLGAEPRQVAGSAMAVYYDRKGRPFAWQFRFDTARWAEVTGRLL